MTRPTRSFALHRRLVKTRWFALDVVRYLPRDPMPPPGPTPEQIRYVEQLAALAEHAPPRAGLCAYRWKGFSHRHDCGIRGPHAAHHCLCGSERPVNGPGAVRL